MTASELVKDRVLAATRAKLAIIFAPTVAAKDGKGGREIDYFLMGPDMPDVAASSERHATNATHEIVQISMETRGPPPRAWQIARPKSLARPPGQEIKHEAAVKNKLRRIWGN